MCAKLKKLTARQNQPFEKTICNGNNQRSYFFFAREENRISYRTRDSYILPPDLSRRGTGRVAPRDLLFRPRRPVFPATQLAKIVAITSQRDPSGSPDSHYKTLLLFPYTHLLGGMRFFLYITAKQK